MRTRDILYYTLLLLSKIKAPEPGVALGLAQYSFTFEISPLYASAIRGR